MKIDNKYLEVAKEIKNLKDGADITSFVDIHKELSETLTTLQEKYKDVKEEDEITPEDTYTLSNYMLLYNLITILLIPDTISEDEKVEMLHTYMILGSECEEEIVEAYEIVGLNPESLVDNILNAISASVEEAE